MDVCIFYFSGTGNTKWVADKFVENFSYKGMEAEAHSIELLEPVKVKELAAESRILMFAYPVYGSYIPEPMKRFVDEFPPLHLHNEIAIVCTQMMFSGDGAWFYHDAFEEKGYKVKWTYHFIMPSNVSIRLFPLPYTADQHKIKKILAKCEKKIVEAVDNINMNVPSLTGSSTLSYILGLMQRPFYKKYIKRPFKTPLKADHDACVKCMRCIQICPESNIRLSDGEIVFGNQCTLCLRCYNFCPKTAITAYGVRHKKNKPTYKGPEGFDPALIAKRKDLMDFIE